MYDLLDTFKLKFTKTPLVHFSVKVTLGVSLKKGCIIFINVLVKNVS